MASISNLNEATAELTRIIHSKGGKIIKTENLSNRGRYGNLRLFTDMNEVYHLKFSKKLIEPRPKTPTNNSDLDEKLRLAVKYFGNGENTLNGLDEDLLLELIEIENTGQQTYFVTVMSDGRVLWRSGREAYEFVQRYDTIIHFPKAFQQPVGFVPTGWLINKSNLIIGLPNILK